MIQPDAMAASRDVPSLSASPDVYFGNGLLRSGKEKQNYFLP
jgi:hypothetical protein